MAVPTLTSQYGVTAVTATTLVVTRPSYSAGDMFILQIGTQASSAAAVAPDGTWTLVTNVSEGSASTSKRLYTYVKRNVSGGEPSTYTFTGLTNRFHSYAFHAVHNAKDEVPTAFASANSSDIEVESQAVTAQGESLLIDTHLFGSASFGATYTPPATGSWTKLIEQTSSGTGSTSSHMVSASKSVASAGVVAAQTWTMSVANTTGNSPGTTLLLLSADVVSPPVVTVTTPSQVVNLGDLVTMTATATNTPTSWLWEKWPSNSTGSIDDGLTLPSLTGSTTDTVTFTPTAVGMYSLKVTATNAGGTSVTAQLASVMVIDPPGTAEIYEGAEWLPCDVIRGISR